MAQKLPSLNDLSQMLAQLTGPLPSQNPEDLAPGTASLDDVQAKLAALSSAAPPGGGSDLFSKNSAILQRIAAERAKGSPSSRPIPQGIPSALPNQEAPSEPLPLIPASAVSEAPAQDEDIKSIMEARQKLRAQQMAMANAPSGDPWMQALAGLGGLGADVLSKSGNNNFMNAATAAYRKPIDAQQALRMKALDAQISDQGPLIELAKARAARAGTLSNQKELEDHKNKNRPTRKTFEQEMMLKKAGGQNSTLLMPNGETVNTKEANLRAKLVGAAQKTLNSHLMSPTSNMGKNQQRLDTAQRLETLAVNPDGSIRDLDSREAEELAIGLANMLGSGSAAMAQIQALVPATRRGNTAKFVEWLTGNPHGLEQQEFTKRALGTIQREKETAGQQLIQAKTSVLAGMPQLKQYYPQDYNRLLTTHIPNPGPNLTADKNKKTIVKQIYSPSRNQTMVTYSDNSEDIIDGQP